MTRLALLILASTVFVTACGSARQASLDSQNPAATAAVYHYLCESGETVAASYVSDDSATVQYQGHHYTMQIAISASGARYAGDKLEWWTKGSGPGSEGTLLSHNPDGTSGDIIELCAQQ